MIAEETGVASVADPLGGSYYVEALTDAIEAEAMAEIARIDDLGGMVAAVEAGHPQAEIADAAYVFQRELERGERRIVGVNAHVAPDEGDPEIHRPDPAAAERQVQGVQRLARPARRRRPRSRARRPARGVRGRPERRCPC